MKVLVTGACGMLGRLVVDALDGKHQFFPTDVLDGCEKMDITDTGSVFDTMNRLRPEMVIHCAAMTDVDGCTSKSRCGIQNKCSWDLEPCLCVRINRRCNCLC